jgi:hypothetical protein
VKSLAGPNPVCSPLLCSLLAMGPKLSTFITLGLMGEGGRSMPWTGQSLAEFADNLQEPWLCNLSHLASETLPAPVCV